jgi:sugar (pentulose or hexulose) kinase
MSVALGIDMGSHGARAAAVRDGAVVASAAADYESPPPARRRGDEAWRVLAECVRSLPADLCRDIAAVGITGVRGAVIGLADDGTPITPLYPDFDPAAVAATRMLAERIGEAEFLAETGCPLFPLAGLPKMLLPAGRPVHRWLGAQDYIGFRLTGEIAVSTGSALRLGILDPSAASVNRKVLLAAGIPPETIPPLVAVGDTIGFLERRPAGELGLPEDIPVVACPGDVPAGFVAVGAKPNTAFANLGTTTVVCCLAEAPAAAGGYTHEVLAAGRRSIETGFGAGGITFDWLARLFGLSHAGLEAAAVTAGPSDVRVEPELLSPWGAQPAAMIGSLGVTDGRGEIARAAYRSVAERLVAALSELAAAAAPLGTLVLGGGGASSDLLCREIASLWKGSLQRLPHRELAAEGAASVASLAAAHARTVKRVAR